MRFLVATVAAAIIAIFGGTLGIKCRYRNRRITEVHRLMAAKQLR